MISRRHHSGLVSTGLRLALLGVALLLPAAGGSGAAQEAQAPVTPEPPAPVPLPPQPTTAPPRFLTGLDMNLRDIGGSVFYWGQGATIDGTIGNNAVIGGASATLEESGRVEGDLVAFAGNIAIDGEVMRDVYAWSGEVRFGPNARVHGNVTAFTGSLRIDGAVYGVVRGGGGRTVVLGEVGSLDLEAGTLTLGPEAVVHGDIVYRSNEEAEIDPGARVGGQIIRNVEQPDDEAQDADPASGGITFWSVAWRGWRYLATLLVGLTALLLGGAGARAPARRLLHAPASALGFGFVAAIVVPVACLLAIVLLVTAILGVVGGLLFVIAIYLGGLVTAQAAGTWLLRKVTAGEPSEYLALALGLLLLMPLAWIPYVGFLLRIFAAVLGLGAIYLALRDAGFPWTRAETTAPAPLPPS